MNRIVMHHTGGSYTPSTLDLGHYHFVIDGSGTVQSGKFPVSANAPGARMRPGSYAAHTRRLNTGSIGVSLAAMGGAKWGDPKGSTKFPVKPEQVESLITLCARLCTEYGVEPKPETVLSHAEVQGTLGVAQRGKWDFDYDPLYRNNLRDPRVVGDYLRGEINKAMRGAKPTPSTSRRPVLRRGSVGEPVAALQYRLGLSADGAFGPVTESAVRKFQAGHQLVPDGIVGDVTWLALGL